MTVVNGGDFGQWRQLLAITQLLLPVLGTQMGPKYLPYRVSARFRNGKEHELL